MIPRLIGSTTSAQTGRNRADVRIQRLQERVNRQAQQLQEAQERLREAAQQLQAAQHNRVAPSPRNEAALALLRGLHTAAAREVRAAKLALKQARIDLEKAMAARIVANLPY